MSFTTISYENVHDTLEFLDQYNKSMLYVTSMPLRYASFNNFGAEVNSKLAAIAVIIIAGTIYVAL